MRAVIFDFDGVVANSEPAHERAWRDVYGPLGMTFPGGDWYAHHAVGIGDSSFMRIIGELNGRELSEDERAEVLAAKRDRMEAFAVAGEIELWEGVEPLLRALREAGAKTALCTGSRRGEVEPILSRHGILELFETTVCSDDVERTKPDPAPYVLAMSRLGVTPGEAVAIEDSPTGMASAKAAGVRIIGVLTSFPAEKIPDADRIVRRITDLTPDDLLDAAFA